MVDLVLACGDLVGLVDFVFAADLGVGYDDFCV